MLNKSCISWSCIIYRFASLAILKETAKLWKSCKILLYLPIHILPYLLTYWLTYLLTHSTEQSPSWEANFFQLSKEISAFHGTQRFIAAFTSAIHLSISWASSVQSIPPFLHLPSPTVKPPRDAAWDAKLRAEHWTSAFRLSSKTNTLYNKRFTSRTSFRLQRLT